MTTRNILCALALSMLSACATAGPETDADDARDSVELDEVEDLSLSIRRVDVATPIRLPVAGRLVPVSTFVEFVVSSSEPIPARALDPVLVVGDRLIRDYRYEKPNELVFREPEPDTLRPGARMHFQWGLSPRKDQVVNLPAAYDPDAVSRVSR